MRETPAMGEPRCYRPRYDALIVGARCAGAATALLLARAGANVLLVDRQKHGSDTVSTHALMRAGVLQLKRWGLLPRLMAAGTPEVRHATFHYGGEAIRVDIKTEHDVAYLCGPRRTVLDRILVDAAREAGADVRHDVSLTELAFGSNGRVSGAILKDANGTVIAVDAAIVIGADGRQSTVAKQVGAETFLKGAGASGYVYGYYENLTHGGYHWYFENDAAAGIIPTNDNRHCVFVGVPSDRFAETFRGNLEGGFLETAAANSPRLRHELDVARLDGRLRGFSGGVGYLRQSYGPGWALVGDAGYFKDPLTAHGITDAFRDAELLANAVRDGQAPAFERYQDERDSLSRPLFDATDAIATFDWDLDLVKKLHDRLSEAMKRETERVAANARSSSLASEAQST
jgi:2-polyprenyl-6-methoxyphenol hydroxylase-like FAD-dependent oxidoreductase